MLRLYLHDGAIRWQSNHTEEESIRGSLDHLEQTPRGSSAPFSMLCGSWDKPVWWSTSPHHYGLPCHRPKSQMTVNVSRCKLIVSGVFVIILESSLPQAPPALSPSQQPKFPFPRWWQPEIISPTWKHLFSLSTALLKNGPGLILPHYEWCVYCLPFPQAPQNTFLTAVHT